MATAREEAERLVAAALAAASFASRASRRSTAGRDPQQEDRGPSLDDLAGLASLAARFLGGREAPQAEPPRVEAPHHRIATGSAECCICPICRAIAAVRDPSPEFAERLATGASDLAAGLTSILRAFGEATRRGDSHPVADLDAEVAEPAPIETRAPDAWLDDAPLSDDAVQVEADEDDTPWPGWSDFGSVWQAATRVQDDRRPAGSDQSSTEPKAKKTVAKKTVAKKTVAKKTVAKAATKTPGPVESEAAPGQAARKKVAAQKAVAKTAAAKKAPAKKAASTKAAPSKATAKATAKKATPSKATSGDANPDATPTKAASAKKTAAKKARG